MKNEMSRLMPQEMMALVRFCQAAMIILNARLFTLFGMMFCAMGFGWVMWEPDWIRAFAACAFSVLVFFPLQRMEARKEITTASQDDS